MLLDSQGTPTEMHPNPSECGFTSSVHILHRLTMFAVNTGIWTAIFALLSVILVRVLFMHACQHSTPTQTL